MGDGGVRVETCMQSLTQASMSCLERFSVVPLVAYTFTAMSAAARVMGVMRQLPQIYTSAKSGGTVTARP